MSTPPEPSSSRRLPSLLGVEAFVAVGRAQSFSRAAEQLNLTVSALSKRVAGLEALVGEALFLRSGASLSFTPRGLSLFAELSPIVDELGRILAPPAKAESGKLVLHLPTSLAALWLIGELKNFHDTHAGLDLKIETGPHVTRHKRGAVDAAIRYGLGNWEDVKAERLIDGALAVFAAEPLDGEALSKTPLLGVSGAEDAWHGFFDELGMSAVPGEPQIFENAQLMLEAAANGLGAALAPRILALPYLTAGRLTQADLPVLDLGRAFYFVAEPRRWEEQPIRQLREWLCARAKVSNSAL